MEKLILISFDYYNHLVKTSGAAATAATTSIKPEVSVVFPKKEAEEPSKVEVIVTQQPEIISVSEKIAPSCVHNSVTDEKRENSYNIKKEKKSINSKNKRLTPNYPTGWVSWR